MTPTNKLLEMLEQSNQWRVTVFLPARGRWRREDVHRWEAWADDLNMGHSVHLYSWYTITECARFGVYYRSERNGWEWEVCAFPKKSFRK